MSYRYFLRGLILLSFLFISSCAKDMSVKEKQYIQVQECMIPIDNSLELTNKRSKYEYTYFSKEEYFDLYNTSKLLYIYNTSNVNKNILKHFTNSKYMREEIIKKIQGYDVVFSKSINNEPYESTITILRLGKTTIVAKDYTKKEVEYMVNYCNKHPR